jgi:hypothetical protein
LAEGERAFKAAAEHLHRMGAAKTNKTFQIEGVVYEVTVEVILSPRDIPNSTY